MKTLRHQKQVNRLNSKRHNKVLRLSLSYHSDILKVIYQDPEFLASQYIPQQTEKSTRLLTVRSLYQPQITKEMIYLKGSSVGTHFINNYPPLPMCWDQIMRSLDHWAKHYSWKDNIPKGLCKHRAKFSNITFLPSKPKEGIYDFYSAEKK